MVSLVPRPHTTLLHASKQLLSTAGGECPLAVIAKLISPLESGRQNAQLLHAKGRQRAFDLVQLPHDLVRSFAADQ